jgi:hypothetical protein
MKGAGCVAMEEQDRQMRNLAMTMGAGIIQPSDGKRHCCLSSARFAARNVALAPYQAGGRHEGAKKRSVAGSFRLAT